MRVLFDVNVPRRLRGLLLDHEIITAQEQGWEMIENSELLRIAEEAGFEVAATGAAQTRGFQVLKISRT